MAYHNANWEQFIYYQLVGRFYQSEKNIGRAGATEHQISFQSTVHSGMRLLIMIEILDKTNNPQYLQSLWQKHSLLWSDKRVQGKMVA